MASIKDLLTKKEKIDLHNLKKMLPESHEVKVNAEQKISQEPKSANVYKYIAQALGTKKK